MAGLIAVNQEDAADTLGINVRTLQRWIREGCPGKKKKYPIAEMIEWAREHKWGDEDGVLIDSATGDEAECLKTRLMKEKVEKLERENQLLGFKVQERKDSLVDASRVEQVLIRASTVIRSKLEILERNHGRDAANIVIESLDELDALLEKGELDYGSDEA